MEERKKPVSKGAPLFEKGVIILASVLMGGLLLSYFFIPQKSRVEIWLETKPSNFETILLVSGEIDEPAFSEARIPAKTFEVESAVTGEFPASGTKLIEEKARGTIRVYNAYSTLAQPLVATTRFVSAEGKLFRTPKRVVIPGGHYEGGKLVPGYIDIEVVADEPGEDYNIGPSTFSIPGLAGTAKYTAFYGKSFQSMTGGRIAEVSQVTEEDLEKAVESLKEIALEKSRNLLPTRVPEDRIFLEEGISQEISEISPFARAGQEIDRFLVQVKSRAKALTFAKADLENFAKHYIDSRLSGAENFDGESLKIDYFPQTIDLAKEEITLKVEMQAKVYSEINIQSLKEKIKNETPQRAKEILSGYPQISKIKIEFSSFWLRRVPSDLEKIEISLKLD